MMKHILYLAICLFFINSNISTAQCTNGDLELGNLSGWTGWTGTNVGHTQPYNFATNTFIPGFVNGRHTIVSPGYDPVLGGSILPTVADGNYALKLGSTGANAQAEMIAYTFQVTQANANFSFKYAMVLQAPNHPNIINGGVSVDQNPIFKYWFASGPASLSATPLMRVPGKTFSGTTEGNFLSSKDDIVYSKWQTECVDLSAYIGQTLSIYFITSGCAYNAHYGYAYIDGLCSTNNATPNFTVPQYVCASDAKIFADGSTSIGALDHYWQMEKLSTSNINSVIAGTAKQQYLYNTPPGNFDLSFMYATLGGSLTAGFYKITLGVRSCSGNWITKSAVTEIRNGLNFTVSDIYRCCNASNQVTLSAQSNIIGSFEWYDSNNTLLGTGSTNLIGGKYINTIAAPNTNNGTYNVLYTATINGCKTKKQINVINKPSEFRAYITNNSCINSCNKPTQLTANILNMVYSCGDRGNDFYNMAIAPSTFSYQWSTGETTQTISVNPNISSYSVTVSNGCVSNIANVNLNDWDLLKTGLPTVGTNAGQIYWDSYVNPTVNTFRILYGGMTLGEGPAYNANRYELWIFNREGNQLYYNYGNAGCDGFKNGEISWSARDANGNASYEIDTYFFQLKLYNCNNSTTTPYAGNFAIYY